MAGMAHKIPAVTSPAQQSCHLFKLAAELRNRIYGLAFTNDTDEVKLLEYDFPSTALLCTSRQIYSEASGVYKAACITYLNTTRFVIGSNSHAMHAEWLLKWERLDSTMLSHMPLIDIVVPAWNVASLIMPRPPSRVPLQWRTILLDRSSSEGCAVFRRSGSAVWRCVEYDGWELNENEWVSIEVACHPDTGKIGLCLDFSGPQRPVESITPGELHAVVELLNLRIPSTDAGKDELHGARKWRWGWTRQQVSR